MACKGIGSLFHSVDVYSDPSSEMASKQRDPLTEVFVQTISTRMPLPKKKSKEELKKTPHYQAYRTRIPTHLLNEAHALLYAPDNQGLFEELFHKGVVSIWKKLCDFHLDSTPIKAIKLIKKVGNLRRSMAHKCGHGDPRNYGTFRTTKYKTRVEPDGPYSNYLDRFIEGGQIIGLFEGQAIVLTSHIASRKEGYKICHEPPTLPLARKALAYHLLAAIDCSPDEVHGRIATFHWWMANLVPFKRGSAACAEMIVAALWLFHGKVPPQFEPGISGDCEALCTPDLEEYIALYPHPHG